MNFNISHLYVKEISSKYINLHEMTHVMEIDSSAIMSAKNDTHVVIDRKPNTN